ncbi:MAG: SagB/ThcOx family dehydrogenase [Candidatus Omnitrophota bacterium]
MRNTQGAGDRFQKETKYLRGSIPGGFGWQSPGLYKEYPGKKRVKLPHPETTSKISLDEAVKKRKSVRDYSSKPLSEKDLSYLLWISNGINRKEHGYEFRTVPSAGALYPVETYLVVNNVESIPKGVYHYSIKDHLLEEIKEGDFSETVARAALGQDMCADAGAVFIWTGIFQRSKWKYGERAYRYVYLDAGHVAENLALASVGLGLGSCQVAALFDDEINEIIGVDGIEESVIYMSVVGYPV